MTVLGLGPMGAAIARALAIAHGIEPQRYLPYAEGIVDTLRGTLPGLGTAVEERTYDGGEARLDMCLAFLARIVAASDEAGQERNPVDDRHRRSRTTRSGAAHVHAG